MDDQFDCAGHAQPGGSRANLPVLETERTAPRRLGALLRRLSGAGTALAVAYLVAPPRPFDDAQGNPERSRGGPVSESGPARSFVPLTSFLADWIFGQRDVVIEPRQSLRNDRACQPTTATVRRREPISRSGSGR